MARKLSAAKAKRILKEGVAQGKPLSPKQKKFFGAVAGGQAPRGSTHRSTHKTTKKRGRSSPRS